MNSLLASATRPGPRPRPDHHRSAVALLGEIVADLGPYGCGTLSPSAYDTAWVSRVIGPDGQPAFPSAAAALHRMQHPDGSFGDPFPHSIVPTLAALLALTEQPGTEGAQRSAVGFLTAALPRWRPDRFEAIGFEVIVPYLLRTLSQRGIALPFPARGALMAMAEEKLSLLDPERLYAGPSALVYSLEAFSDRLDFSRCGALRHRLGGYGASPAATAAALLHGPWDPVAATWLQRLVTQGQGTVPVVTPIEHFEIAWILADLLRVDRTLPARLPPAMLTVLSRELLAAEGPDGVASSHRACWPPESDDTAVNITVRRMLGLPVDERALLGYFAGTHFTTFPGERSSSLTSNAHALEALALAPYPRREQNGTVIRATRDHLLDTRQPDGSWQDKWHISPLYATACSVHALLAAGSAPALTAVAKARAWARQTWDPTTGGWGSLHGPTAEETAYGVHILLAGGAPVEREILVGAQRFLAQDHDHPPLWISKQLYTPVRVARGAVLSAQIALEERLPG